MPGFIADETANAPSFVADPAPSFTPDSTPSFVPEGDQYPLGNPLGEDAPKDTGVAEKVALAIKRVNEDPVGAFADSVAVLAHKFGIPNPEGLGRDIYALIQSSGPAGAEFAPMAAAPKSLARVEGHAATEAPLAAKAVEGAPVTPGVMAETTGAPKTATISEGAPKDFAGNINLDRILAPDDVKQVIRDTAAQNADFMDARRGVVPHVETDRLASLLGWSADAPPARKLGQAYNAHELTALDQVLTQQATRVRDAARLAAEGGDAAKSDLLAEINRLVGIQADASGATAEAGRALNILGRMKASQADASRVLDAAKSAGNFDDIIDGINRLHNQGPEEVANFIANSYRATTPEMITEAWINALLSSPSTHAANILSNTLVALYSIPEAAVTAGISKITGSGVGFGEVGARAFGFFEGIKDGIRAGAQAFATEEPSNLMTKLDAGKHQAIPGLAGRIIRIPGRALMAEDEVFKSIAYRQEINAQAYRQAVSEGLKGGAFGKRVSQLKAMPTEAMQNAAHEFADKQTFTNRLGPLGRGVLAATNEHKVLKVIVPFVRTPLNIFKYSAERSLGGLAFKEERAALAGKRGAIARDQTIAKILLGSAVSASAVYLAAEGFITGPGPTDPRERAMLYKSGWQPDSVRIGDNYYAYSRLEPLGTLIGVAAAFNELYHYMHEDERKSVAGLLMGAVSKNVLSKTFLSGLSDLFKATNDPDRYGETWVQRLAGTLVPNVVAQAAKVRDPYLREAKTVLDAVKARIPGLRETLPAKRDVFGEPIKLGGAIGPDMISPIYQSQQKHDPAVDELLRLKVPIARPSQQISGVTLEPQEYETLQTFTGSLIRKLVTKAVTAPKWSKLPDEAKKEAIDFLINHARSAARAAVRIKFPDITQRIIDAKQNRALSLVH